MHPNPPIRRSHARPNPKEPLNINKYNITNNSNISLVFVSTYRYLPPLPPSFLLTPFPLPSQKQPDDKYPLTTPLTELFSPILKLLQTLRADTRSNVDQTSFEIFKVNGPDFIHGHV